MDKHLSLISRALIGGTIASITSVAALAVMARCEGKAAAQPLNATSHWWHGPQAAKAETIDLAHTGTGYATHHAATIFWAAIFEAWAGRRRATEPRTVIGDAVVMAGIAAAVDYVATPKRFTPGWELVLSKRSMTAAYAAMAAGLAIGALASKRLAARNVGLAAVGRQLRIAKWHS